jgi:hypothetical protein
MTVSVFTPVTKVDKSTSFSKNKLFLAGTIEMGNSPDWQKDSIEILKSKVLTDITVFNPRRVIPPKDKKEIEFQIKWELDNLQKSDIIFMNLCVDTISPISLLELGMLSQHPDKKIILCCPEGYQRSLNVDITMHHDFWKSKNLSYFTNFNKSTKFLVSLLNGKPNV